MERRSVGQKNTSTGYLGPVATAAYVIHLRFNRLTFENIFSRLYTLPYLPKTFDQTSLVESSLMPGDVSKMASQVRVPVQGGSHRQSSGQPVSL